MSETNCPEPKRGNGWRQLLASLLSISLIVLGAATVHSQALEDVEAEMEDAVAETDGAEAAQAEARERAAAEAEAEQKAMKDMKAAISNTKSKARDIGISIKNIESSMAKLRESKAKYDRGRKTAEVEYQGYIDKETRYKERSEESQKVTEEARLLKEQIDERISVKVEQLRKVEDELREEKDYENKIKADLLRAKAEEKKVSDRLVKTKISLTKGRAALKVKVNRYTSQIKASREVTAKHEGALRKTRKDMERLEEEASIAEAEAEVSKQRAAETRNRVKELRKSTRGKRKKLLTKKRRAKIRLKKSEAENTRSKIISSRLKQRKLSSSTGGGKVKVQMHKKKKRKGK